MPKNGMMLRNEEELVPMEEKNKLIRTNNQKKKKKKNKNKSKDSNETLPDHVGS